MSKFHDNLTLSSQVTVVLVTLLLEFSKQWKNLENLKNIDDAEHSGRPNSAVVPENIKVHKMVLADRKLKLR